MSWYDYMWEDDHPPGYLQNIDGSWYSPIEVFYDYYGDLEWRDVPGHPKYSVSETGLVASFYNVPNQDVKILATWPNQYGHRMTRIEGEHFLIHRLVAMAFIPNPYNYPIVRHLNDDPTDNRVENLAWGTMADNHQDMVDHDRDFKKAVYCYETNEVYRSCAEAARVFDVSKANVTRCCEGIIHTCKGYYHLCYLSDKDYKLKHLETWLKEYSRYKPVKATNLDTGEEIIFSSRKEAAEKLGIPDCGISSTISGHTPHSHRWRFEDWSDEFG